MKQVFQIGDNKEFDGENCILLAEIGESHGCYAILDSRNNKVVRLKYVSNKSESNTVLELLSDTPELKAPFKKKLVGYYMKDSIVVPAAIFRDETMNELMPGLFSPSESRIIKEELPGWQLFNTYYVPIQTYELVNRVFSGAIQFHCYTVVLQGGVPMSDSGNFLVCFKTDSFSVIALKNGALLLAQIYPYAAASDVLYWLLRITQEFSLSQHDVRVELSGLIDRQSVVYRELYNYFINIYFAATPPNIRFPEEMGDYPEHFFSSLFKLLSCAS
jgi:hypothetical protein